MTQEDLAESVGTSQTQIMRLETGRRKFTLEWAEKLSYPLLCSAKDLLFGADDLTNPDEKKLLETYRSLPPNQRETVLNMANYLADHRIPDFKHKN